MNVKSVGSVLWVFSFQYFVVQVIVASAYDGQFSLAHNTISDLGNTICAAYDGRSVCSPLHLLMNISFITLGITQALGSLFLYKATKRNLIGFGCMILAGLGTIIVGLFPENTIGTVHTAGAALPFVLGNIAMLLLASQPGLPHWLKYYGRSSGMVGLVALLLFVSQTYLGIGLGGMERVAAYPQTIWMIVLGCYYLLPASSK